MIGGYGWLRVLPETGRRHQIRRHLASIGHPVVGDDRYGDVRTNRFFAETCALGRPFLHLSVLEFRDEAGRDVRVEIPLPPELEMALDRLRRMRKGPVGFSDDP